MCDLTLKEDEIDAAIAIGYSSERGELTLTIDGTPYGELAEILRTQRQRAEIYRIETTFPNEGQKKFATAYTFIAGGE